MGRRFGHGNTPKGSEAQGRARDSPFNTRWVEGHDGHDDGQDNAALDMNRLENSGLEWSIGSNGLSNALPACHCIV